ncbi:MAG: DUF4279 domain-containing protein [Acidobacteria bacterium]|nr:DUF4279 domain-containing protein [Acidobacteriota bacterium]
MTENKIIPFKPLPPKAPIGEPLIQAGGEIDESSVSLRFFGDDLDPDEISDLLNCQPTDACRKGDILPDERYHIVAKTGSWRLSGEIRDDPLEKQILELFDRLSGDLEIWRKLTHQYNGDLFCGLWLEDLNRELAFTPELMNKIAERGLTLNLDIYYNRP